MEDTLKEIIKYWKIIKRRKVLCIIFAMLASTIGIIYVFNLPFKYKADSTVFIEESLINNLVEGLTVTTNSKSKIRVLRYAMLSRSMIGDVITKIDPLFLPEKIDNNQSLITDLQKRTRIRVKGGELFTVSIEDPNPSFARDYINVLVNTYVEQNIKQNRDETYSANRFLTEQVDLFKGKVDDAVDAIIQFRKKHGVYVAVSEDSILNEIRNIQESLETLEIDIDSVKAKKNVVERQLSRVSPTVSTTTRIDSPVKRSIIIQQKINQLRNIYTDDYPEIVRLKSELANIQLQPQLEQEGVGETSTLQSANPVYQSMVQKRAEINGELSALNAKKFKLKQMMSNRKRDLRFIPENKKVLTALVKEKDSLQAVYTKLLSRMSQAEVSKQMEIGNKTTTFRVVDSAQLPNKPSSPDIPKFVLIVIAGSLLVGLAVGVMWEMLDTNVKHIDDLDLSELNIPMMGMISQIPLEANIIRERRKTTLVLLVAGLYYSMAFGIFAYMKFLK